VVVARVVEAVLLVRHPPEPEARHVSHLEEVAAPERERVARCLLRVGDLAELLLPLLQATAADVDEPGMVRRLRPAPRPRGPRREQGERLRVVAGALLRSAREVRDVSA